MKCYFLKLYDLFRLLDFWLSGKVLPPQQLVHTLAIKLKTVLTHAQHFGLELQSRGGQLLWHVSVSDAHLNSKTYDPLVRHIGTPWIDFSA